MNQILPKPYTSRRAGATVIDYIIVFAFSFWYIFTFGIANEQGAYTVSGFPALVPLLFWGAWIVGTEAYCGQTLGHALLGIKVVSLDGSAISFGQALKRRLCDAIEISWCFGLIAFILVKSTGNQQRLGDIVAKTYVTRKDEEVRSEFEFESELPPTSALKNQG